jgi:hypothetical protein
VKQIVASYQEICQKNKDYLALRAMDATEQYYQRILACNLSQTLKVLMEVHAEIANDHEMLAVARNAIKDRPVQKSIFDKNETVNILQLIDRDKADELFMFNDYGDDGQHIFQTKNYKKMIEYKKSKYIQNALFEKIKLVLNLKAVSKILYIKLLLKKIDLAKSLFILEIEQGEEVFIPPEISIN